MARILNLFSENDAEIQYTRAELDLLILPYIEILRKEFEEKFNKIAEIAESVKVLLEENRNIRTEMRGFNWQGITENEKKINILIERLSKDFKITLANE